MDYNKHPKARFCCQTAYGGKVAPRYKESLAELLRSTYIITSIQKGGYKVTPVQKIIHTLKELRGNHINTQHTGLATDRNDCITFVV
jgi:hypothetical protein